MSLVGTFGARDGQAGFVVDATAFPVVFVTFFGTTTEDLVHRYFACIHELAARAELEDTRYVTIADGRTANRPPATVRTLFAKLSEGVGEARSARNLLSVVVHNNAMIRGALTAIQWVSRRKLQMETAATMPAAIQRVREALEAAGVALPDVLGDDYPTPALPMDELTA